VHIAAYSGLVQVLNVGRQADNACIGTCASFFCWRNTCDAIYARTAKYFG